MHFSHPTVADFPLSACRKKYDAESILLHCGRRNCPSCRSRHPPPHKLDGEVVLRRRRLEDEARPLQLTKRLLECSHCGVIPEQLLTRCCQLGELERCQRNQFAVIVALPAKYPHLVYFVFPLFIELDVARATSVQEFRWVIMQMAYIVNVCINRRHRDALKQPLCAPAPVWDRCPVRFGHCLAMCPDSTSVTRSGSSAASSSFHRGGAFRCERSFCLYLTWCIGRASPPPRDTRWRTSTSNAHDDFVGIRGRKGKETRVGSPNFYDCSGPPFTEKRDKLASAAAGHALRRQQALSFLLTNQSGNRPYTLEKELASYIPVPQSDRDLLAQDRNSWRKMAVQKASINQSINQSVK